MRILYLHQYFTTPEIGGGTRSYEFGKRLVQKGHEVEFISGPIRNTNFIGEEQIFENMKVNTVGSLYSNKLDHGGRMRSFLAYAFSATLKGTRLKKPDIIFATSTPLTVAIPALFLSVYYKIPFVFEVRDLWPEAPIQMGAIKNPIIIRALRLLEKVTYLRARHIVALSPGMAEGITKQGIPSEKITMIPNSSDINVFNSPEVVGGKDLLQQYDIQSQNIVLYAGAVSDANGVDILIPLALKLQEIQADVHVVVAGDGKRLLELQSQKIAHNLKNITFTGHVSKYEIAKLFKLCKASMALFKNIPILMTNSPNKLFDSLAAGRPVISNMRGWVQQLLQEYNAGIYVEPDDVDSLCKAVLKITTDDAARDEMANNALALAKSKFCRDKLAAELEAVLVNGLECSRGVLND